MKHTFSPLEIRLKHPRALRDFVRREDGSFVVFSLFLLIAMLMVGGMAVDFMRTENTRVHLQNTADRAVLAAANMEQSLPAEQVVRSYFEVANLDHLLEDVTVVETDNTRSVSVQTAADVPSTFLKLVGIDELPAAAGAGAAQAAQDVEVSIVIDVSSSMRSSNRMNELREALTDFITEIVPDDAEATDPSVVTVSLVPYSMTVNPGSMLGGSYTNSGKHAYSSCLFMENEHFETLAIDTDHEYEQYSHFQDNSGGYNDDDTISLPYCPTDDTNAVLAHSIDPVEMQRTLDGLQPWDATSIDVGVKWGLHMLDPSFRPVMADMIGAGDRSGALSVRPSDYDDPNTRKILIVMTDGENDEMRELQPLLAEGPAPVWRDIDTGRLSVLVQDGREEPGYDPMDDENSRWYFLRNNQIRDYPDQTGHGNNETVWPDVATEMHQLTWPEVMNLAKTNDLDDKFFKTARDAGYISDEDWDIYRDPIMERVSQRDTVERLSDICALARDQGVVIYGIAFDPPNSDAEDAISDCSSSTAHFFTAEGLEIKSAFAAIAREVLDLRLTF